MIVPFAPEGEAFYMANDSVYGWQCRSGLLRCPTTTWIKYQT
ncbi:hypothetical protein [Roseovarius aestuarii]|nr:hypothetical protein [Roseovarius aestuarii]